MALQTALVNTGMDTETPVLSQALLDSTDWADTMTHGEQIPHDDVTVLDLIEQAIEEHRDDPALLAVDATLTYGELDAFAWGVCRALSDAGVKRGDVVAIAMDSSISAVNPSKRSGPARPGRRPRRGRRCLVKRSAKGSARDSARKWIRGWMCCSQSQRSSDLLR